MILSQESFLWYCKKIESSQINISDDIPYRRRLPPCNLFILLRVALSAIIKSLVINTELRSGHYLIAASSNVARLRELEGSQYGRKRLTCVSSMKNCSVSRGTNSTLNVLMVFYNIFWGLYVLMDRATNLYLYLTGSFFKWVHSSFDSIFSCYLIYH